MPHILIEYSRNLEERADIRDIVDRVHQAAIDSGVFPTAGTRTRAVARDIYRVADRDPENAFVHVTARIGAGRDPAAKTAVTDMLFEALSSALAEAYATSPLAISFELQEADPTHSRKKNNLHERLSSRNSRT